MLFRKKTFVSVQGGNTKDYKSRIRMNAYPIKKS